MLYYPAVSLLFVHLYFSHWVIKQRFSNPTFPISKLIHCCILETSLIFHYLIVSFSAAKTSLMIKLLSGISKHLINLFPKPTREKKGSNAARTDISL